MVLLDTDHFEEERRQIQKELEQVCQALTERLGRPSRWSGLVEITDDPNIRGAKPFRCDIVINVGLIGKAERWRTLIHEMLHTFSAGYKPLDYVAFRGWEEGVVEGLQRILRAAIVAELGLTIDETVFTTVEAGHEYAEYVQALEKHSRGTGRRTVGILFSPPHCPHQR